MNESAALHCLEQLCLGKLNQQCDSVGIGVTLSVFLTALAAAGISVAIHIAMYVWFYRPRMSRTSNEKSEVHNYEDMEANPLPEASIELKGNKAYQLKNMKGKK